MKSLKTMVYEMNVDWNWIKQRPHFIAEEFQGRYDLTVLYPYRNNRQGLQHREVKGEKLRPVRLLPFIGRNPRLFEINLRLMERFYAAQVRKLRPDYVFVTKPEMVGSVIRYPGKVIYDCMDDYYAFSGEEWLKEKIFRQEKILTKRADLIFVSSERLKEVLVRRYGPKRAGKIHVVRNGFGGEILPSNRQKTAGPGETGQRETAGEEKARPFTLCYFGTIDTWFDFDLVMKSLEQFPDISYLLAGPANVPIPQHERIRYIGTVEHDRLASVTAEADCYVMPFHVNDIIRAVDPVKLYEYLNFDKNILCVRYNEVERFGEFVRFYTDQDSFAGQIRAMQEDRSVSYSADRREQFLRENSWKARADRMEELIAGI